MAEASAAMQKSYAHLGQRACDFCRRACPSKVRNPQGEDKPSPLLWTKWLGRLLRRHSRGDGLSSPCALTCKSPLTCFGSVEISVVPGEKYTWKYICFLYFSLCYPVLSKAEISLTASAKTTIISLKSFNTYIDNHRINGTFSTVCERVV